MAKIHRRLFYYSCHSSFIHKILARNPNTETQTKCQETKNDFYRVTLQIWTLSRQVLVYRTKLAIHLKMKFRRIQCLFSFYNRTEQDREYTMKCPI